MISRINLTALAVVLALAACDRKPAPAPGQTLAAAGPVDPSLPHERAEPVTWDDTQGAFTFEGRPLTAGRIWRFEDGPQGFGGTVNITFSPLDGTHISNEIFDPQLRSPTGLALDGARFNLVLVRLSRMANGPPWDGSLFWVTDAHDANDGFHAKPFLGAEPGPNETVILAYDLTRPTRGGSDWQQSIIQQLRLDTDDGAGGKFLLREMAVVQNPASDRLRAPDPSAPKPKPTAATAQPASASAR
jgi:hypothetical protein